jgi:hypothetical protein
MVKEVVSMADTRDVVLQNQNLIWVGDHSREMRIGKWQRWKG